MSHKLLTIVSASLIAFGCNSQQNNTTSTTPVVKESPEPAVTTTDEPTASVEENVGDHDAQEQTTELLKSIANAFYEYQEHFGHFPPAASTDANGKPLLSWRVHILPFLGAYDLYEQFHLDEPWNSDRNIKLLAQMPTVYQIPVMLGDGKTTLMVFTGVHTVFGRTEPDTVQILLPPFQKKNASAIQGFDDNSTEAKVDNQGYQISPVRKPLAGPSFLDLTDGTSNTILAVLAGSDKSIPWTKPEDLPFQPENPASVLGTISDDGFTALFWDSHVERIPKDIEPARLNSWIDSTEFARNRERQQTSENPLD